MTVNQLRNKYPKGTLVRCICMDDPFAVPTGTLGIVEHVDDEGQIHMNWSNGSSLALIPDMDTFMKVGG